MQVNPCDVVILGGGAAGLFCAATAAERGCSVTVVDHAAKLGRKILISGGGRCNFTNRHVGPQHFRSANPHFARSALARFRPEDFLALVQAAGIPFHERRHGQLFCDSSAKDILNLLLDRCHAAGVRFHLGQAVHSVTQTGEGFTVSRDDGPVHGRKLVLATGGLSIPTIGATDLGHRLAKQFGLRLVPTAPALVPFTLGAETGINDLTGIAVDALVSVPDHAFHENLLFTHVGLSGPAILQVSNWWEPGTPIEIDLLPGQRVEDLIQAARAVGSKVQIGNLLAEHLPKRLVQHRLNGLASDRTPAQLQPRDLSAIADAIHAWTITPSGTEGYRKAEATRGGIDTRDLSSQTMETRTVPGLYAIGEVVDVTGWLGGYNFHWAWASGHACGLALSGG